MSPAVSSTTPLCIIPSHTIFLVVLLCVCALEQRILHDCLSSHESLNFEICKSDYVLGLAMEQLATKARLYPDRAIAVLSQLVPGDPVTERYRDIIQQLAELLNDPAGKIVTFI